MCVCDHGDFLSGVVSYFIALLFLCERLASMSIKKLQFACPVIIKIERLNFSRKLKKITLKLITGRRGIAKQLCYISEFNKKEWTR